MATEHCGAVRGCDKCRRAACAGESQVLIASARTGLGIRDIVRGLFFALLPAAAAGGALALAPMLGGAGLASARASMLRREVLLGPVGLLLALVAWATLTSFWSAYPDHGQAWRLPATVLPGLAFVAAAEADAHARKLTRAAVLASILVLAALLAVEALFDMPINRPFHPDAETWQVRSTPGRGAAVLVALIWGALGALVARRAMIAAIALAAGGALLAGQFGMQANLIGFALGAGAFALGLFLPRAAVLAVSGGLALWLATAPFLTPLLLSRAPEQDMLAHSWAMRVEIWRYASARILEQPWIGHGLDASRAFADTIEVNGETLRALPLHPHSISLQIWLETGVIGAALACAAILFGGWRLAQACAGAPAKAAAAAGAIAALGFIANVSFGAWQEWWIAALMTAAAAVAAIETRKA